MRSNAQIWHLRCVRFNELAASFGGVVALDSPGLLSSEVPGRLFVLEDTYYADATRHKWLKEHPEYEVAGLRAV